jgi:hypothetical protein
MKQPKGKYYWLSSLSTYSLCIAAISYIMTIFGFLF